MNQFYVATLYQFVKLQEYEQLKLPLLRKMQKMKIKGTIILAREGINGSISGSAESIDIFLKWLRNDSIWNKKLNGLEAKFSVTDKTPFARAKVKLKQEIVTMGIPDIQTEKDSGTYVKPKDWNELILQPDVVTIDVRNNYEIQLGKFKGSKNPETESFREFPKFARESINPNEQKKVAMYCTGGIRCEKATSYLKKIGFEEVYHLRGGILKYLEDVPKDDSLWEGECFVFDERVAINHSLEPGNYIQCHACRMPLSKADINHPQYILGESCHLCYQKKSPQQQARYRERQKQIQLAKSRGETHIGEEINKKNSERRFKKLALKKEQRAIQKKSNAND